MNVAANRTDRAVRNAGAAALGQVLSTVFAFATRTVFIYTLGATYLGVNSLFTNVLAVLSFAELGVGTAMTYALFGPLARKDHDQIAALMAAFAKAYRVIGLVVAGIGLAIAPFLDVLMKDEPDIPNLLPLYLVFLSNSVFSYFISYSRTLLIASQNVHLDVLNRTGFALLQAVLQVGALLTTGSFMLFLVIQTACQVASNVAITRETHRLFPGVLFRRGTRLHPEVRRSLVKNVAGMLYHKLGSAAVLASTSLFISAFVGVVAVGYYSNYVLITGMVALVVAQLIAAVTPSVGDLVVKSSREASSTTFYRLFFVNFVLMCTASAFLAVLLNPFVALWAGHQYVLSWPVTVLIIVNLFLYGIRQTAITFINGCGLFWKVRYKSLVEAVVSVLVALLLMGVFGMGISGALLSVTLSTLATNIWWEPLVVMRGVLGTGMARYLRTLAGYAATTGLASGLAVALSFGIGGRGVWELVIGALAAPAVVSVVLLAVYRRSPDLVYARRLLAERLKRLSRLALRA